MRPYTLNINVRLPVHEAIDLQLTVEGLSKLFVKFLYKLRTNSAVTIFNMLINHLNNHYKKPIVLEQTHFVRLKVCV